MPEYHNYDCYVFGDREHTAITIAASSSFSARKVLAEAHGVHVTDVVAIRQPKGH